MGIFNNLLFGLTDVLYILPVSLISLTVHEFFHGYVAYKLGDSTAKDEGRLTLNPLKHLDLVGFLFMLFFKVGYAKPVPVNPLYFNNPKKGMLLTAAAGPLSNLVLGIVSSFFASVLWAVYVNVMTAPIMILFTFFYLMTLVNLGLAVFNLIPVHPFDGSRIVGYFLPGSYHRFIYKYGNYIYIAFFVLLLSTDFIGDAISEIQLFLTDLLFGLWSEPAYRLVELFV